MRQLVGLKCSLCEKSIGSIAEGYFCNKCACPVHNRCVKRERKHAGGCSMCGAATEVVAAQQEQARKETAEVVADVAANEGSRHVYVGLMWILGGIGATVCCFGIASNSGGTYLVATGPILFGIGQIIYGLRRMRQTPRDGPTPPKH